MVPPLRTEGPSLNPTARYYARRVAARSRRPLVSFQVPTKVGDPKKPRKDDGFSPRLDVLGPLVRQHYPVVPASCQRNLLAAFDKRCNFYSDKRVAPDVFKASLRLLDSLCPSACGPVDWTLDLFNEWNAQFDAAKRARHVKAARHVSDVTSKQFGDKQIFVKIEALLKRHDPNWAPRIIYQSTDLHNVILGPIMQVCTKRMFGAMDLATHLPMSFSGAYRKDTESLCEFISSGSVTGAKFIESDFSSNDSTQVRDVHLLEVIWLRRLGAPKWVTSLMLYANSFAAVSRQGNLVARIRNQLPTGAQSTTFRNSLWNASQAFCFAERHSFRGVCLVLGDDMLMRVDNPWRRRQQMARAYRHVTNQACMVSKVKVYDHLSECTFLSKQFVMTSWGYVLVPKLGKALARFNANANNNQAVSDRQYLAGKALSYSFEFRHCPPLSKVFLERYLQLAPDGDQSLEGVGWFAKGFFIRHGTMGILDKIETCRVMTRDDMTRFYHWKYSLTATDVIELAMRFVFGEEDLDVDAVGRIIEDFVD